MVPTLLFYRRITATAHGLAQPPQAAPTPAPTPTPSAGSGGAASLTPAFEPPSGDVKSPAPPTAAVAVSVPKPPTASAAPAVPPIPAVTESADAEKEGHTFYANSLIQCLLSCQRFTSAIRSARGDEKAVVSHMNSLTDSKSFDVCVLHGVAPSRLLSSQVVWVCVCCMCRI